MTHNYTCSYNKTVLIDELSAYVGGSFAMLCAILGVLVNSITMYVIIARKSLRYHCTSPSLFFLSLSDLAFCTVCLPLQGIRFGFRYCFLKFRYRNSHIIDPNLENSQMDNFLLKWPNSPILLRKV